MKWAATTLGGLVGATLGGVLGFGIAEQILTYDTISSITGLTDKFLAIFSVGVLSGGTVGGRLGFRLATHKR